MTDLIIIRYLLTAASKLSFLKNTHTKKKSSYFLVLFQQTRDLLYVYTPKRERGNPGKGHGLMGLQQEENKRYLLLLLLSPETRTRPPLGFFWGEGEVVVVVDSSCCFADDQTRPGPVLAARLYQWCSMDRWDGRGWDQKSSVRFGSLHFTSPIPRFLMMMIIIIMMMTMIMHSSCWLVPRTFLFSSRVVRLESSVEMMNEGRVSEKASSADRWTGIAFTRSGLSSRCYAGDDSSSSLLGGTLVCRCFSGGSWIS